MIEFQSALFQGDALLQAIADDQPAPGGGLTRISQTQNANDPAVLKVQLALLDWRADALPVHGADGSFGGEGARAVHRFKAEELGVPEGEIVDDVGPLTVQRLDAIRADAETPAVPALTVVVLNQFGDPLVGVGVTADDGLAETFSNTDEAGAAFLAVGAAAQITLDRSSVLLALGDLLDRPVHGLDPGAAIVVTPSGTIVATAGPGEQMDLVVAARVDVVVDLLTALEGTPRVEGIGARLTTEGESVRVALQAGDGAAAVLLDPVVSVDLPLELPSLAPFIPPDAYVVQPADTGEGLAERFLDDPSAFADLSDHPLVVGETLVLPGEAVPGWVALAAEPLPDPPSAATWFSVVADDILSAVFDRGDPAPLHNLIIAMQSPPPAMADPVDVVIARVQGLGAFVALGAGAGVAEGRPVDASEGDELGGL